MRYTVDADDTRGSLLRHDSGGRMKDIQIENLQKQCEHMSNLLVNANAKIEQLRRREAIPLETWINDNYNSTADFARIHGVSLCAAELWISHNRIVSNGCIYAKRRTL